MLADYEVDCATGMSVEQISEELYRCTGGYPFLVSWLCKWMDEDGGKEWTFANLENAQKALLKAKTTLFDDLIKNVENYPELRKLIADMLTSGNQHGYSMVDPVIELGTILGMLTEKNGKVAISNRIFETLLYDYTVSVKSRENIGRVSEPSQFIQDGRLDMPLVLIKFQEVMKAEYRSEDEKFVEQQGRLLLLCFLKPIINGTGFYYVEAETRNSTRMDIVVSYGGEEYIIELKIWHGDAYREKGIRQLEEYMESRKAERGYLVSFSFLQEKEYKNGWMDEGRAVRKYLRLRCEEKRSDAEMDRILKNEKKINKKRQR